MFKYLISLTFMAMTLTATGASAGDGPELTSSVVRINNKRFQKVASGKSVLFIPSVGLPLAASLGEALCPANVSAKDEVLEISKPAPANAEVKAAAADILAHMASCKPAEAEKPADANTGKCKAGSTDPVLGADGKVKDGTGVISTDCTKHFGN